MKVPRRYTRVAIVLGDQLFSDHSDLEVDDHTVVFMAEDYGLCTHYHYHKHKLTLFLSAMRSHADGIAERYTVSYHRLTPSNKEQSYWDKLAGLLFAHPDITEVVGYEVADRFFREELETFCTQQKLGLKTVDNPGFMTSRETFASYVAGVKRPFMKTFYEQQRRRLDILVDAQGNPAHGKWSFDEDNRKKLPKKTNVPALPSTTATAHTIEVQALVDQLFADHPGDTSDFWLATTRAQALQQLESFLTDRFSDFGPYEDAFEPDQVFLFHSVLSPYINMGLLTAREVVDRILEYSRAAEVHYPSVEGIVRQLIGWREFVKGTYDHYEGQLRGNFFDHHRKLTPAWYDGTTGIAPLDDTIRKANKYGYTHHIERLMIVGNMMLLCEVDPEDAYKWFMEMYVDSADWVMVPNVFGMTQFAGGGVFATKPYICGANYWSKMSRYSKTAEWAPTVNALYWNFIDKHRAFFASNHRMSMMVSMYDKKPPEVKAQTLQIAQQLIDRVTQ